MPVEDQARKLPLKRAETAAGFVLAVQLAAGVAALVVAYASGSTAAEGAAWQLLVAAAVWVSCLMHQRLRRLVEEETLEAEALAKEHRAEGGTELFEADEATLLTARQRLQQFEKYALPIFSLVVTAAFGGLSWYLLHQLATGPGEVDRALMAAVVFFGLAFVSFLLAKYTAGLATQTPWRPLRPGANHTMACALTSFVVGVALVCHHFQIPVVERVVAYAAAVLFGVLAVEVVLHLVMGLYRPRLAGQEQRWAHDSRLLGMLTTSGGILRTTAETLDYQFGFKVSETWFFKFMERAIAPLIVFQLATLYVLTSFVIVEQGEEAVIERFGAPRSGRQVLGPGLHLKWPWPIECAYKHPVKRVEMLEIGEQLKEDVAGYVWTVSHAKEPFNLLVANRQRRQEQQAEDAAEVPAVSLLAGTAYVYYYVDDFYSYLYTHKAPRRALEQLCYRELTHYAAQSDFLELLGHKIGEASAALQERIQEEANRLELGVRVTHVTLRGLHPPPLAGESFEAVVGALEEKEARTLRAKQDAVALVADAEAEAHRKVTEAKAYAHQRKTVTPAMGKRFDTQYAAYRTAPEVFLHRTHIRSLEEQQADARKFILPEWVRREVLELDLDEKLPPGLGFGLEASEIQEGTAP